MRPDPTKLTPTERELLLKTSQGLDAGPKSTTVKKHVIRGADGTFYEIRRVSEAVVVNGENVPEIISEEQGRVLDCGHVSSALEKGSWQCYKGHFMCERHELQRCHKCHRPVCMLCAEEDNGQVICPDCSFNLAGFVIVVVVLILLGILAASVG